MRGAPRRHSREAVMNKESKAYGRAVVTFGLILFVSIFLNSVGTTSGQHEGHSKPKAATAKTRAKTAKPKSKRKIPRRVPVKRTGVGTKGATPPPGHIHSPGMVMPAPKSTTPSMLPKPP